jgi:hypothetical protein
MTDWTTVEAIKVGLYEQVNDIRGAELESSIRREPLIVEMHVLRVEH